MAPRRPAKQSRFGEFRPSSVHQHAEVREPAPGARALFARLRPRLLGSRPLIATVEHPHWKDAKGRPVKIEQFGAPTFRNVIDPETGAHV